MLPRLGKQSDLNNSLGSTISSKKKIRLRNKLYKKYRRCRSDDTWECYRLQKKLVTKLKRITIKQFCSVSVENATTPGGFWKRMKPLLPATTDFSNQEINVMDDGKLVLERSNLFNAFFFQLLSYLSQSSEQHRKILAVI